MGTGIDKKLAESVVNEALSRGLGLGSSKDVIGQAEFMLGAARKAYEGGIKSDDVMVFINMEENFAQGASGSSEKPGKDERHSFMEEVIASTNRGSITKRENLPEPAEIEGSPPDLPGDITQKSDAEVRQLHSEFFAAYARSAYLLSIKENESENAKSIMDFYEDRELSKLEQDGTKGTVTALKALAREQEPRIGEWRAKWLDARAEARELRGLKEIYDKACDRFSREMSMREYERGGSGGE